MKKDEATRAMMDDDRQIEGFVSSYIYDTGGDELWGIAVFRDEPRIERTPMIRNRTSGMGVCGSTWMRIQNGTNGNFRAWPSNE